ncbi:hypothetical protein [Bradyrhizobium zhanjiangense]|uniref:hypothetical protein n=1 Tax=Bradyrhizobium zhanjiangense TaxID=1325107 RepID=UPI003D313C9B
MPAQQGTAPLTGPIPKRSTFYLITAATGLNAVVTLGLRAVLIELLKAEGLSPSQALAFGSVLGIIQVSARAIDFMCGVAGGMPPRPAWLRPQY